MEPRDRNLAFLAEYDTKMEFSDVKEILLNYDCAGMFKHTHVY